MTTSSLPQAQPRPLTLADLLPAWRSAPLVRDAVLVVAAAALTGAAAQVAFTVPWTPVPYTLQTGAVLLSGTVLGARRGLLAMLVYLAAGGLGLGVFAEGEAGIAQIFGRTGGYLIGFVVAGVLVGRLAELRWDRSVMRSALLMVLGTVVIYAIGVPVLALVGQMTASDAVWYGAAVFVPWDLAKIVVAAVCLPLGWRAAGR
jgi:biotin transport system substrate-specific component